jgi:hypothetical protein
VIAVLVMISAGVLLCLWAMGRLLWALAVAIYSIDWELKR